MLLLGLLLGPGYGVYTQFYSGENIGVYKIYPQENARLQHSDVSNQSNHSFLITLDPSMNPVRLVAVYFYRKDFSISMNRRSDFLVSLSLNGDSLWTKAFSLSVNKESNQTGSRNASESIITFNVGEAGEYLLDVSAGDLQTVSLIGLRVVARKNVSTINIPVMVFGIILSLFGFISLLYGKSKS